MTRARNGYEEKDGVYAQIVGELGNDPLSGETEADQALKQANRRWAAAKESLAEYNLSSRKEEN